MQTKFCNEITQSQLTEYDESKWEETYAKVREESGSKASRTDHTYEVGKKHKLCATCTSSSSQSDCSALVLTPELQQLVQTQVQAQVAEILRVAAFPFGLPLSGNPSTPRSDNGSNNPPEIGGNTPSLS